ncbi:MAG TPA: BON domain-containing protein [Shinella sp.]|jgi:hypothetical protein|uniref:BON domain-containing protein n=1 Tax=Shinella sp. TaxID=1870904 RepID=UPI002E13FF9A|nr:BON domain-containing protein [Shinella sp.]
MTDRKQVSREDDFRDFEERDIRDGWPYADRDGDPGAARNAPYGKPEANLDQLENEGVEITTDPAVQDVDGVPLPFSDEEKDSIADDELEDRITQVLEVDARVDPAFLEIAIRDGVAHLEGSVDSEADRRHLIDLVRRQKGVRDVQAEALLARGVDSHMPRDVDE